MITEMGKGKKVFMVLFMLVVFFSLIVWLIKKFSELKEEADKRRAKENEERHAESAIFEEQEEKHTREEEMQERKTNMKNDFKLYNKYVNFLPQHTWSKYSIDKDMAIKKPKLYDIDSTVKPAQLELMLFYQSLIKAFRVIVISVKDIKSFISNEKNFIRLQLMIYRVNKVKYSENSLLYQFQDDIEIDEKFTFQMEEKEFTNCILYVSLWNVDVFHQELLLGAVSIDLEQYDYNIKNTVTEEFLPVKQDFNVYGYMLISLCHVPSAERLVCVVICGKELKESSNNTSILNKDISPYVKISLLNDGKLIKKCKTNIACETNQPVYNEMIDFFIPDYQVETTDILFNIIHKGVCNIKKPIGSILIGNNAPVTLTNHWKEALSKPDTSIAKWHPITR